MDDKTWDKVRSDIKKYGASIIQPEVIVFPGDYPEDIKQLECQEVVVLAQYCKPYEGDDDENHERYKEEGSLMRLDKILEYPKGFEFCKTGITFPSISEIETEEGGYLDEGSYDWEQDIERPSLEIAEGQIEFYLFYPTIDLTDKKEDSTHDCVLISSGGQWTRNNGMSAEDIQEALEDNATIFIVPSLLK